jgi:hypothetical protein
MTLKPFAYTALRYRPSYLLGEEVNIALLFHFFEEDKVSFIYPKHLSRIAAFYPPADLAMLRKCLRGIERKLEGASGLLSSQESLGRLLLPDASNLYFEPLRQGRYQSADDLIAHYRELYFGHYRKEDASVRKDEQYIQSVFERSLPATDACERDYVLETSRQKTVFEFAWRQDGLFLAKCIGFDLQREASIQQKALRWLGEFSLLQRYGPEATMLALLSKPRHAHLHASYRQALQVLRDAPVRLVEEPEIASLAQQVAGHGPAGAQP